MRLGALAAPGTTSKTDTNSVTVNSVRRGPERYPASYLECVREQVLLSLCAPHFLTGHHVRVWVLPTRKDSRPVSGSPFELSRATRPAPTSQALTPSTHLVHVARSRGGQQPRLLVQLCGLLGSRALLAL